MKNFTSNPEEPEENMVDQTGKLLLLWVLVCFHFLFSGVTYDISNKHRLGYSEFELV